MNIQALLPTRWTRPNDKVLGVVMIVRNEAERLPRLLSDLAEVADEVVVVDTGSTDATASICRAWGVTLVQERWQNDFARARNRSLSSASAQFLLWLDGDDRLPESTREGLIELRDRVLPGSEQRAFSLQIHNTESGGMLIDAFKQIRIVPRHKQVRFRGAIHERISDALSELRIEVVTTDLVVEHTGYADQATVLDKARRNLALLDEAVKRDPRSVHVLLHLAQTQMGMGLAREADATITRAISHASAESAQLRAELLTLRATYRKAFGNVLGASYDLDQAVAVWPEWGLPYAALAQIRAEQGEWELVAELAASARAGSFDPGMVGFRLVRNRSNVEVLAARALKHAGGEPDAVLAHLREALEIDQTYVVARLDLGQALLDRGEYAEARMVLEAAGEDESAIEWFVDISTSIGLARAMTGDEAGARACLAPLLDIFAYELDGADDVGPMELAEVLLKAGAGRAASNMITLFQETLVAAA